MMRAIQSIFLLCVILMRARAFSQDSTARDVQESVQFDARRFDFKIGDSPAFIILPTKPRESGPHPWLWYAPTFIGRHPDESHTWMFKQLLDAGFFIGGIEVGESYGSPKGREIYQSYYEHVTEEYKLSPRACLMPQSRGGLMLYNWAAEHSDSVACIAGIYTVCNLESYPGLDKAAPAYELTPDQLKESLDAHNPIARLKPLARAGIPVFHIHGDNDAVVPLEANAGLLVERYKSLGGPATLVVVPGKGHQVCDEFFKSPDLMKFLFTHQAR